MTDLTQGYAEAWVGKEGDVIIGKVCDLSKGWSDQSGSYYPIVTIDAEDKSTVDGKPVTGLYAVHCFHTALRNRLIGLAPTLGERVGIKFVEMAPLKNGKKGQTVARYVARVEGRTEDVWGSFSDGRDANPEPSTNRDDGPSQQSLDTSDDIPF